MDTISTQVIEKLTAEARLFFDSLNLEPGTYTAAELAANCRATDRLSIYNLSDLDALYVNEKITIGTDTFRCELPRKEIFRYLWKFEQLEKVARREKARFTRIDESNGIIFTMVIPKAAAHLAKFTCTDDMRPVLQNIYVDIANSSLVATDTYNLNATPVIIENAPELPENKHLYIPPKVIKNICGRTTVTITDDAVTFTNESGEVYTSKLSTLKYPDYRRVCPSDLSLDGYLQFTPAAVKKIKTFLKSLKNTPNPIVVLTVESGANTAELVHYDCSTIDKIATLELVRPTTARLAIGFHAQRLTNALAVWDGGMWLTDPSHPVILDCKNTSVVLAMTHTQSDIKMSDAIPVHGDINTFDRFNHISKCNSAPEIKKSETTTSETAEQPDPQPTEKEIADYISAICNAVDDITKLFFYIETINAAQRLRELADLAGVAISDIFPECATSDIPTAVPDDIETTTNTENETETNAIAVISDMNIPQTISVNSDAKANTDAATPIDGKHTFAIFTFIIAAVIAYVLAPQRTRPNGQNRIRDGTPPRNLHTHKHKPNNLTHTQNMIFIALLILIIAIVCCTDFATTTLTIIGIAVAAIVINGTIRTCIYNKKYSKARRKRFNEID